MLLNEVITLGSIAADKTYEENERNKGGKLQRLSAQ